MTDPDAKAVDAALDEASMVRPEVPDHLMNAVMMDAARLQPRVAAAMPRQSLWDTFLDLIGGWPAVGGLAAAGVAGVWLGAAPPVGLESAAASLLGETEAIDLWGTDVLSSFEIGEGL